MTHDLTNMSSWTSTISGDRAEGCGVAAKILVKSWGRPYQAKVPLYADPASHDPLPSLSQNGATPLCKAAQQGHETVVRFLVTEGNAAVDQATHGDATPLDSPVCTVT